MTVTGPARAALAACGFALAFASPAHASSIVFSNLSVDGRIAVASGPAPASGGQEIEAADDFLLTDTTTTITAASFIGLLPVGFTVNDLNLEIYRVFPFDSAPPSGDVPTRVNSPSDVAFDERDLTSGISSFTTSILNVSFAAANSVVNGINPIPGQTTGGEGPVAGEEVRFDVVFSNPLVLPADHYFFVPQIGLNSGNFLWLSALKPIVAPGTPFAPDLQAWIRNTNLDPDWLRIGTDIVGGTVPPTYNMAFELRSDAAPVPEPTTWLLMGTGLALVGVRRLRKRASEA